MRVQDITRAREKRYTMYMMGIIGDHIALRPHRVYSIIYHVLIIVSDFNENTLCVKVYNNVYNMKITVQNL